MNNVLKVNMADLNTVKTPNKIKTTGLGSCVGIVLYETRQQIGGMAHIMLPSSENVGLGQLNKAKYADTAVLTLLDKMIKLGANRRFIVAKLAGGSQMFQFKSTTDVMRIGPRNVEASKKVLSELKIPIVSEDTGGNIGRTIELDTNTGILNVKTVNQGVKEI